MVVADLPGDGPVASWTPARATAFAVRFRVE